MKFKYTGPLKSVTVRGVDFPKGKAVKVEDSALADKLQGIPEFQEMKNAKNKT